MTDVQTQALTLRPRSRALTLETRERALDLRARDFALSLEDVAYTVTTIITQLVYDQFTDTNGTNLTAHTPNVAPLGSAWAAGAGTITIQSNRASTTTANSVYYINSTAANCTVSVSSIPAIINATTYRAPGLACRVQNASNYWLIRSNPSNNRLEIAEVNGGAVIVRAFTAHTPVNGVAETITVVLAGNLITAIVGSDTTNYTSSQFATQTQHGLRVSQSGVAAAAQWDNFEVAP